MRSTARHKYSLILLACTFFLLLAGASVTSTKSSMAVPDWPLSFGQWMPEMKGGVFYEHGHRMVGALVGVIMLGLAGWSWAREASRGVRILAWAALIGVMVQGLLGGLTVLWGTAQQMDDTHPVLSSVHALLAFVLFGLVIAYASVTAPGWRDGERGAVSPETRGLSRPAWLLVALVYLQMALGAVMRQFNAGLILPDFPLSQGRLVPQFTHWLVGVSYAHRVGAVVVAVLAFYVAAGALRLFKGIPWVRRPAHWLCILVAAQVMLGAAAVWTRLSPWVSTAHHAVGSLVLAASLVAALRISRSSGWLRMESRDRGRDQRRASI